MPEPALMPKEHVGSSVYWEAHQWVLGPTLLSWEDMESFHD